MVNVSKKQLKKDLARSLSKQFVRLIAKLDKKTTGDFLGNLLTETEQTMLIKRLAAVLMLHEKYTAYRISTVLKMSPTTIVDMQARFERGEYHAICKTAGRNKREREEIWRTIGVILRLGMPPMAGEERKYWLQKHFGQPIPQRRRRQ